jgi:transposase
LCALKIPIRGRKAAMFYKTEHGATISNILTSLIQTAELAGENPHEYLVALQDYKSLVFKEPESWLPRNYRQTLEKICFRLAV